MGQKQMMIVGEVAAYLRCSPSTVHRFVRRGQIPHYRFGRLVRFRQSEIEHWLSLHHEGPLLLRGRAMPPNPDQLSLFPTGGKNGE